MHYTLRYEKDPIWSAFHRDQDLYGTDKALFEPRYIWYSGTLPYAISPAFKTLKDAKHWFELKCCKGKPALERRHIQRERRLEIAARTLEFAKKYDRRNAAGRRWIDQVAKYL